MSIIPDVKDGPMDNHDPLQSQFHLVCPTWFAFIAKSCLTRQTFLCTLFLRAEMWGKCDFQASPGHRNISPHL